MLHAKKTGGFTLIELLITLAVLAIVLAFAVPSFTNLIENSRVTTQTNNLLAAVNLARSEAVKRGVEVSIQNEPGGFVDGGCVIIGALDGCQNARDNSLMFREFPELNGVAVNQVGVVGVTFDGRGYQSAPGANVQIEMEPRDCTVGDNRTRVISVSLAGRASVVLEACD
jgi:type IV fimbrial biogenesis protein FimT